jgi:hypothetical protein
MRSEIDHSYKQKSILVHAHFIAQSLTIYTSELIASFFLDNVSSVEILPRAAFMRSMRRITIRAWTSVFLETTHIIFFCK